VLGFALPGYIDFTEKQKVPHSYSRAEENARFANGVRDDERKKNYIKPEIAGGLGWNPELISRRRR